MASHNRHRCDERVARDEGMHPRNSPSRWRIDCQYVVRLRAGGSGAATAYHTAKGGILMLSRAAAVEYAR